MSYGIMLRRLKQEEAREERRAEGSRATTGRGAPRALQPADLATHVAYAGALWGTEAGAAALRQAPEDRVP